MGDVIKFPTQEVIARDQAITEEVNKAVERIDMYCDEIFDSVVIDLLEDGYDVTSDEYIIDISMAYEAIKSLLFKAEKLHHPIQELSKTMYELTVASEEYHEAQLEFDF
jgi:hypothetical protein